MWGAKIFLIGICQAVKLAFEVGDLIMILNLGNGVKAKGIKYHVLL